jgi:hypothetical protein
MAEPHELQFALTEIDLDAIGLSEMEVGLFGSPLVPTSEAGTGTGKDGREVELRRNESGTLIQWRYTGDAQWRNLVSIAELAGPAGTNGKSAQFRNNGTNIQWRLTGDALWIDLVDLDDITGPRGSDGTDGTDGREVALRLSSGMVQWSYVGSGIWTDLVSVASLAGPPGLPGSDGADGSDGTNGSNGTNGTNGSNGREVQLQKNSTHIQWRYVGDASWINLVALTEITGPPGSGGGSSLPSLVGKALKILAVKADESDVEWITAPTGTGGSGSGGATVDLPNYAPPLASDFPITEVAAGITLAISDTKSGMGFKVGASSAGVHLAMALRPTTSTFAMIGRMRQAAKYQNPWQCGFCVRNSANGRVVSIGNVSLGSSQVVEVDRWTSSTTYSANVYSYGTGVGLHMLPNWFRIVGDGTNITFYVSGNGSDWTQVWTETIATFIGAVDQIGIFNDNESTSELTGVVDWYEDSTLPARRIAVGGGGGGGSASFSGCRVRNSTAASSSMAANVDNLLSWDTEDFDVGGWHSTVTNPSRLTVPSGVNYVEVTGYAWSQANRTGYSVLWLRHYNSSGVEQPLTIGLGARNVSFNAGNFAATPTTGVVAVNAGDYFTLSYQDGDGGNPNIPADQMWFSIRAVG